MAGQNPERREILRMMAVAAAAAPFTGFSKWSFACGHIGHGPGQIRPAAYQPLFFTAAEYALLSRLTELILPSDGSPGAREAGAAEFIDFLVAHDPSSQYEFRTGLTWLEAHAATLTGKPFLELAEPEQIALLKPLAYAKEFQPGRESGREFFRQVREATVMAFYTSETGFRELDNPSLRLYTASPECPHQDDPEHRHLPPPRW